MKIQSLVTVAALGFLSIGVANRLYALVPSQPRAAADPTAIAQTATTRHPTVYSENGVALDGQDVVAYFTQSALVEGSPKYSSRWQGTQWLFSSAAHRDMFSKNPTKYAPQYGGYCAKAAAGGVLATTVPTAWEVRDGKLYLNYSADAQKEWKINTSEKIVKANANWPKILNNETLKQ
jgi:YHS domain-containing protein